MTRSIYKITLCLFLALSINTGCLFNTSENIKKLPDKKFYFTEFIYILPGQDKDAVYNFFKNFPVKKIMFMLASEYNITIDISDFSNFLDTKDFADIESDGFIRTLKHTWKKRETEKNRITFVFEQDYFDSSNLKFTIKLYNENKVLKQYNTEISKTESIVNRLKSHLDSGEKSLREFDEKSYADLSQIPLIIDIKNTTASIDKKDNLNKIKLLIDEHVKSLDKDQRKKFKHEMTDYLFEKCN